MTTATVTTSTTRLTTAAAAVIVVLTTAAFWLSYAHLHTVAADHGLGGSVARAWAWPATLDLFIVAGELLMLRASLARTTDWWAVALTVVGSGGSIALNVLGVEGSDPLAYVTAAVPPTAALLAFGALMRQVHTVLAGATTPAGEAPTEAPEENPAPVYLEPVVTPVPTEPTTPTTEPTTPTESADSEPLPADPTDPTEDALPVEVVTPATTTDEASTRLSEEEAARVITECWKLGLSQREAGRRATRAPSYVGRIYQRLNQQHEGEPITNQLPLTQAA